MTDWVRLWHDMPTDPKWRVVARKSGQPLPCVIAVFNMMMVNASANSHDRGTLAAWDDEDCAAALDMDAEAVAAIREAMQGKVLDGDRLAGWEKRQPKREDGTAAKRKEEWKERQRNAAERNGTQRNAPETDTESDIPPIAPRKRGGGKHLLPDDWTLPPIAELTPKARECAAQWPRGAYEREGEAFVCFWRSRRRMMSDWRLTWSNRVLDQHVRVMREVQKPRESDFADHYEREVASRARV